MPGELLEGLRVLGREEGVTLFMVLLAGFQALLSRWSGQEDVAVGTPAGSRDRVETEDLVGFFVNMLVLRTGLGGDPSFRELLGRVREVTLGAYAHGDLPFERLVEELRPERDLGRNPLCQVMLVLQNAPVTELALPGLDVAPVPLLSLTSKFDLSVFLWEKEGRLSGHVEYSSDLFDAETVGRLLAGFRLLLEGAVADPGASVRRLPLLPGEERVRVLAAGEGARRQWLPGCAHQLFEEQAARTPDAAAVELEGRCLSYGELGRARAGWRAGCGAGVPGGAPGWGSASSGRTRWSWRCWA